ncbi:sulfotransferase domain-containing protein [Flavimaricola marinus]|uniref:Sulfotransferase domain protein n=1 Tax=Flavimaricola marinus TaxID=1819565 RepID=A0A238LHX2_9RHOB|nr:sulfotransferase domain-containing protein [Flavimaricola marinus]SMY09212.1 Sulfotransferase domain protein [Flavimaricola marinus]
MSDQVLDYDLIILSHHKCATNWLRSILRILVSRDKSIVDIKHGSIKRINEEASEGLPTILANVNATQSSLKGLDLSSQPAVHFVRDPRDAFVSNYWSWLKSHKNNNENIENFRVIAADLSVEGGMLELIDQFQMGLQLQTWDSSTWENRKQVRYEDLLSDFESTLKSILEPSGLILDGAFIDLVKRETAFSKFAGRDPGSEDTSHHYRKGVNGDWKNYFTPKIEKRFFDTYGWLGEKLDYW